MMKNDEGNFLPYKDDYDNIILAAVDYAEIKDVLASKGITLLS
ncbi:hypothetical protein [Lachnospira pectinoschiza]|nr:hypothetical protein [Lachnospira pectinoschiza]